MKQIPGTIVVCFHSDITESIIDEYLKKEQLWGTKVTNCSNLSRYAIEVPPGKEEEYVEKLRSCELVKSVNPFFLKGVKYKKKEEEEKERTS